jgi:glycosylphosphatidylinositol transamidase
MQQAVVLEVVEPRYNAIELSIEGYDGQLPKLDTYWLVYYYAKHWTTTPVLLQHQHYSQKLLHSLEKAVEDMLPALGLSGNRDAQNLVSAAMEYIAKLVYAGQFTWRQARGLPLGAHAPFKEFGVDAATMRLVVREDGAPGEGSTLQTALTQLGEVLENAIRSCSVLIERFHHSYFLYLLTGPHHFVTVERYIVPLVLLIGAMVVQVRCAAVWLG